MGTASDIATLRAALAAGQPDLARAWFDRAARLAPDDPTIVLVNAASSLDNTPQRTATFPRVVAAATSGLRGAHAMLIACELRPRRIDAARGALADLLAVQVLGFR